MQEGDGRANQPYDAARVEAAVRELLLALGENPERDGLKDTPARVARAMAENYAGLSMAWLMLAIFQMEKLLDYQKLLA